MKRTYQPSNLVRKRRHGFRREWLLKPADSLLLEEELKVEKLYLLKFRWLGLKV